MSGTLALASAIAEMDRSELERLVRRRRPQAPAGVADPIGLASELLRPEAILRALTPLRGEALGGLLRLAQGEIRDGDETILDALRADGLVGIEQHRPVALPEVTEALHQALRAAGTDPGALARPRPAGGTSDARTIHPPETAGPAAAAEEHTAAGAPDEDDGSWVTAALTAVGHAAECLRLLRSRPLRLNRNGSAAVAAVRALAESIGIEAAQATHALTAIARAGLTAPVATALLVTSEAESWLAADHRGRWSALAVAASSAMPEPLRDALGGSNALAAAAASLPRRYPLLPAPELAAVDDFLADAEYLGLSSRGSLSRTGTLLLRGERSHAQRLAEELLPDPAPGVYVQPDLSVIVPGPLDPRDEAALAALTAPEHIGAASTRRITEASLAEAFADGTAPEEARALFARVSLTGIPQPLDYLLGSLAERVGGLVVSESLDGGGRTRIQVARPELADTLAVDRALQHLQLQRIDDTTLASRLRVDHVLTALSDARYLASRSHPSRPEPAEAGTATEAGEAVPREPGAPAGGAGGGSPTATAPAASGAPEPPPLPAALAELVERVHAAARAEPGSGDFTRRLELAIRDRATVRVTAEARGRLHEFVLLPVSLNAGRLRASDPAAGVERTLPVNLITAVEPA